MVRLNFEFDRAIPAEMRDKYEADLVKKAERINNLFKNYNELAQIYSNVDLEQDRFYQVRLRLEAPDLNVYIKERADSLLKALAIAWDRFKQNLLEEIDKHQDKT